LETRQTPRHGLVAWLAWKTIGAVA
jgi:hypothetical protein